MRRRILADIRRDERRGPQLETNASFRKFRRACGRLPRPVGRHPKRFFTDFRYKKGRQFSGP